MRRNTVRIFLVVGFLCGFSLVHSVVALDLAGNDGVEISDGVPIAAPNGPTITVYGTTNLSLENATTTNTVNITSEAGNMTLTSSGQQYGQVYTTNLTGTWSNVTGMTEPTELRINPGDKQRVDVSDGAIDLSIRSMSLDDGIVDFWINGTGQSNVTIYNLPTNTDIEAVDSTGTVLDTNTTTNSGVGTFTIPLSSHSVELQSTTTSTPTPTPTPTATPTATATPTPTATATATPTATPTPTPTNTTNATSSNAQTDYPERVWLFLGLLGIVWTGIALSTQTRAVRLMGDADGIAIVSGVLGFLSWGIWSFASLAVASITSNATEVVFTMPELTIIGVVLALIPGYVALTGPAEIIRRSVDNPEEREI